MRERPDCAARLRARLAADPAAPWRISERDLEHDGLGAAESVFAVGNGYVGVRGTHEEGAPVHEPGVVLNGFHETWPIQYPEDAYGLARTGQTIVNATDGSVIRLLVDGEPFDLESGRVLRFERALDMAAGGLLREIELETAGGARVLVRSRRLASLTDRHLVAIDYEVTALDAAVAVALSSELVTHGPGAAGDDPRRGKGFADKVLVPHAARAEGTRALLQLSTRRSGLQLACGIEHRVDRPAWATARDDAAQVVVEADLAAG
jgi:alpha,alpha-trehalose phosphorylase